MNVPATVASMSSTKASGSWDHKILVNLGQEYRSISNTLLDAKQEFLLTHCIWSYVMKEAYIQIIPIPER